MSNFVKDLPIKTIFLLIAAIFIASRSGYSMDLSSRTYLRPQLSSQIRSERLGDALLGLTNEAIGEVIRNGLEKIGLYRETPDERRAAIKDFPKLDGRFIVIPIPDLVNKTASIAHIGLSDSYGETVIYMDNSLYEYYYSGTKKDSLDFKAGETGLNHELKTIALYEEAITKGTLDGKKISIDLNGLKSFSDLRGWMKNHPKEAYDLNDMIDDNANDTKSCNIRPFFANPKFVERIDKASLKKLGETFPVWQEGNNILAEATPNIAAGVKEKERTKAQNALLLLKNFLDQPDPYEMSREHISTQKLAYLRSRRLQDIASLANELINTREKAIVKPLLDALFNKPDLNNYIKVHAINILGEIGSKETIPLLKIFCSKNHKDLEKETEVATAKMRNSLIDIIDNLRVESELSKQPIPKMPVGLDEEGMKLSYLWLNKVQGLTKDTKELMECLEKIKDYPLEIAEEKIEAPLISNWTSDYEPYRGVDPDVSLAIMVASASLAAKDKSEFLNNLTAIADLISHIKNFNYRASTTFEGNPRTFPVRGLCENLVLAALPGIARDANSAEEFQEAVLREKESIAYKRTLTQTTSFFAGYCSEDDASISGRYVLRYALPLTPQKIPNIKCLVLDCDGVLWRGILGEGNIKLTPEYLEFQKKIKQLKEKGIILAICSKNNPGMVEDVLEKDPDMILKKEDFVNIKANWEDKAVNLRKIANELNIGVDSLLFIDDTPAERDMVRAMLPEASVPELPSPSDYATLITALEEEYMLGKSLTEESRDKTKLYVLKEAIESDIKLAESQGLSKEKALLEQKITISVKENSTEAEDIARMSELTTSTNQLNLTNSKYGETDIQNFLKDPNYKLYTFTLESKNGSHGRVGLVILKREDKDSWRIDTFCLSCRVFQMEPEQAMISYITESLKEEGAKKLVGIYIPTRRNIRGKELYENLGFDKRGVPSEEWEIDLTMKTVIMPYWITLEMPPIDPKTLPEPQKGVISMLKLENPDRERPDKDI